MNDTEINRLCDRIRETSFAVHRFLRHGHVEKIYENSLANRLRKSGVKHAQQHPLCVYDEDGCVLGEFVADFLVCQELIIELKAVRNLADEHTAQLLGYLRAARIRHGMLINFGAPRIQVKKYVQDEAFGLDGSISSF